MMVDVRAERTVPDGKDFERGEMGYGACAGCVGWGQILLVDSMAVEWAVTEASLQEYLNAAQT